MDFRKQLKTKRRLFCWGKVKSEEYVEIVNHMRGIFEKVCGESYLTTRIFRNSLPLRINHICLLVGIEDWIMKRNNDNSQEIHLSEIPSKLNDVAYISTKISPLDDKNAPWAAFAMVEYCFKMPHSLFLYAQGSRETNGKRYYPVSNQFEIEFKCPQAFEYGDPYGDWM